jgi:hypothetical protein
MGEEAVAGIFWGVGLGTARLKKLREGSTKPRRSRIPARA